MSAEDKIKSGIIWGLEKVPEAGELFALIVEELWPDPEKEDVWDEIKEKVEKLLNEKISDLVYNNIKDSLKGLQRNSAEYTQALSDSPDHIQYITEKYNVAKGDFNQQRSHFQAEGYELLLLPLFAQMANMHLALIRDGCIHGKSWGWTDKIVADLKKELTDTINEYSKHVDDNYSKELANKKTIASNILNSNDVYRYTNSFNVVNGFVREMTISVLDYRQMWPYMDISTYPKPLYVLLTREVYSDAVGPSYSPILPRLEPTGKMMTNCRIRQAVKIDSVTPSYNGVQMRPMGGDGGHDWQDFVWDPSTLGQMTNYAVKGGDAVWGLIFQFEKQEGIVYIGAGGDWESRKSPPPGHYVSSILATPDPMTTGHVDLVRTIYFGFKLKRTPIFDLPTTPDPNTFSPDIPGVLLSGGFATESELKGWSPDQQKNKLISVLVQYLKPPAEHFQGISDYELIGAGAALGLLLLINWPAVELKKADEDGLHNGIIVAIGSRTQPLPLPWLQSLHNLELAILARGLA
jgi:delta endotoxin, N-terminal domain